MSVMGLIDSARSKIGTPYRHQGRGPTLDCVGLLWAAGRESGAIPEEYDPPTYRRLTDGSSLREELSRFAWPIGPVIGHPGDVLVLETRGCPQHVGIRTTLMGAPAMVHACIRRGQVVEEILGEKWQVAECWMLKWGVDG